MGELVKISSKEKFQEIKRSRKGGKCQGCDKKIKPGSPAIAFVTIDKWADEKTVHEMRDFLYFHNVECLNAWEVKGGKL